MNNSSSTTYLIPASIVIGFGLIAVAIYFGLGAGTSALGGTAGSPNMAGTAPLQEGQQQQGDRTGEVNPVTEADHVRGSLDAPVKVVEYSDFACPFCKQYHETMLNVMDTYGPAGSNEVAWVFRQFPAEQLHPQNAMPVAMASECVAAIGGETAFWDFTDEWFERTLTNDRTDLDAVLPAIYEVIGVDAAAVASCVDDDTYLAEIEADLQNVSETGGRGTPWSIVIGPDGSTFPINGALPQQTVERIIDLALQAQQA